MIRPGREFLFTIIYFEVILSNRDNTEVVLKIDYASPTIHTFLLVLFLLAYNTKPQSECNDGTMNWL